MSGDNGVVSYDESVVSEIQNNNFALTIVASTFSNEIYTNNYIKNLFQALETSIENCVTTIKQANTYFEKLAESEGIPQPELVDLSFMMVGDVVDVTANAQVVTKSINGNLNVHTDSRSVSSNISETIKNGSSIKIIGEENGMYKIEYGDGKIGYVSKDYVKVNEGVNLANQISNSQGAASNNAFESYTGKVKLNNDSSHLNFRSGPSTNDSVIASLDQGTEINVIGQSEDGKWLKVEYGDNQTGWVSKDYVSAANGGEYKGIKPSTPIGLANVNPELTNTSFENYSAKVSLNSDNSHLNFRSGPSTSDSVIGSLNQGTEINVIGQSKDGKWLKVEYGGKVGYVSKAKTSSNA